MSIEQLCLSILYEAEATGYDIRRRFTEGAEALFADASTGAIYPALNRLEAKGLVSSVIEEQVGKPSRKIYRITALGQTTFIAGLHEPLPEDKYQSPFLYFLQFAHLVSPDIVADRLAERQTRTSAEIARLKTLLARDADDPKTRWALEYGLRMTEAMKDSLEDVARKFAAAKRGRAANAGSGRRGADASRVKVAKRRVSG